MKQDKPKRITFSKDINQLVVAGFGIAFFLIYLATFLLLFMSELDTKTLILRSLGVLVVYLGLYLFLSWFVTSRIRQLFLPLDRLAHGLMNDQVFVDSEAKDLKALADSLRMRGEKMNALSQELKFTRENLDDAFEQSRVSRDSQKQFVGRALAECERMQHRNESMRSGSMQIRRLLDSALSMEDGIKGKRDGIYEQSRQIGEQIRENLRAQSDTEAEFRVLGGNYTLLESVHTEAEELIDSIYNEMTALQSLATQINLYVMNTSLDISRAGSITVSALTAMDEIKELSAGINEKTDSVLLLIIRVRNSLKLAMDQTGECREKGQECSESFGKTREYLETLDQCIRELTEMGDSLSDEAGRITGGIYEVKIKEEERKKQEEALGADMERMAACIRSGRGNVSGE